MKSSSSFVIPRVFRFGLIAVALAGAAPGQDSTAGFRQPVLGYTTDAQGVRPIMGVPGAAMLGPPSECSGVQLSAFSSRWGYGVGTLDGALTLVRAGTRGWTVDRLPFPAADRVALGPGGTTAALYYSGDTSIELITGLPNAPVSLYRHQLPDFAEELRLLAVSDSGVVLVSGAGDPLQLRVVSKEDVKLVSLPSAVQAIAFPPQQEKPLVLTQTAAFMLTDLASYPRLQPFALSFAVGEAPAAAFSSRGDRIVIATSEGILHSIGVLDGTEASVSCRCRPVGLEPLVGNAIFALRQESDRLQLFDADRATPRILFVPDFVSDPAED